MDRDTYLKDMTFDVKNRMIALEMFIRVRNYENYFNLQRLFFDNSLEISLRFRNSCATPEPYVGDTWNKTDNGLHPIKKDNSLRYTLRNINTTKFDVCITVQYNSIETVDLTINYLDKSPDAQQQQLASLSVPKGDGQTLDFCLSDFYYGTDEQFEIEFKVVATFETWDETAFLISSVKFSLQERRPLSTYLGRWDTNPTKSAKTAAHSQHWTAIPSSLFNDSTDQTDQALFYEFSGNFHFS